MGRIFKDNKDSFLTCFSVDCHDFPQRCLLLVIGKHSFPRQVAFPDFMNSNQSLFIHPTSGTSIRTSLYSYCSLEHSCYVCIFFSSANWLLEYVTVTYSLLKRRPLSKQINPRKVLTINELHCVTRNTTHKLQTKLIGQKKIGFASLLLLLPCTVFVFYCCITSYHKFSGLEHHKLIISLFLQVRNLGPAWMDSWLRAAIKLLAGVGLLTQDTVCWQNSFSCGGRTEFPIFLLDVGQKLLSGPQGCLKFPDR